MESFLNNQELAVVLAEFRTSGNSPERTAIKLIKNFLPAIKQLSSTYPGFWTEDLIQEGKIALLHAAQKFPANGNAADFFKYAYAAIKNRIINFYNVVVKKQPTTIELILDEDDSEDNRVGFSDDYNFSENRVIAIDLKMQLSDSALAKSGLKPKEITAFRMYFIDGKKLSEIADALNVSDSQVSRLMISAREKVKQILK